VAGVRHSVGIAACTTSRSLPRTAESPGAAERLDSVLLAVFPTQGMGAFPVSRLAVQNLLTLRGLLLLDSGHEPAAVQPLVTRDLTRRRRSCLMSTAQPQYTRT
jgi:hypothetical protein